MIFSSRNPVEFVLPSGKFATFTPPRVLQFIVSCTINPKTMQFLWLVSQCVRIEGERISLSDWGEMDYEEAAPALNHFAEYFARVKKIEKGVA